MPVTEIVLPAHKKDSESRAEFKTKITPLLAATLGSVPGIKGAMLGPIFSQDGVLLKEGFKHVLGVEWDQPENFHKFIRSEGFKAFAGQLKPILISSPSPELYITDRGLTTLFSRPLAEVFHLAFGSEEELKTVQSVWDAFIESAGNTISGLISLSGTSINLEEKKFLGIISWGGHEIRDQALTNPTILKPKSLLDEQKGISSFLTTFSPL